MGRVSDQNLRSVLYYIYEHFLLMKKNFNSKKKFLCLSLLLFIVTYNFDQYDMSSESERHERIHVFTRYHFT